MRFFLIFLFLFINNNVFASNKSDSGHYFLNFNLMIIDLNEKSKQTNEIENTGYFINISKVSSYGYDGTRLGYGFYDDEILKFELSLYQYYIHGENYDDFIKYDAFSIHGMDFAVYAYSSTKYLSIFRNFFKLGFGYFTQEYGEHDYRTPESIKALRFRSDESFLIGLGVSAFILDSLEIYTSANYTYFFDDPDYGETFEKNLFTIEYGLMIKF